MRRYSVFLAAVALGLMVTLAQGAVAQQSPVTAIDIALEPDTTMVQHAMAANARLLKSFPRGFALDETHHPHVSLLQQFVRTDDLGQFSQFLQRLAFERPLRTHRDGETLAAVRENSGDDVSRGAELDLLERVGERRVAGEVSEADRPAGLLIGCGHQEGAGAASKLNIMPR